MMAVLVQNMADSWLVRCVLEYEIEIEIEAGNQAGKSEGILYSRSRQRRAREVGEVSTDCI